MRIFLVILLVTLLPPWSWAQVTAQPLTVVYNRGIAPIKFTDSDGHAAGILNDYWKLLGQKNGLEITFREVDTFSQSLDLVRAGDVDLHAGIFSTEERRNFLNFSHPILDLKYYIYCSSDITVPQTLEDSRGLILGVVQGGYTEKHIKKVVPTSRLAIYPDFEALFQDVLDDEIKVFVSSDIHLNFFLSKRGLDNPFKRSDSYLYEQTYYGATAKQNSALITRVRKGQEQITDSDRKRLKERWLHYKVHNEVHPSLTTLTPAEIEWIKQHPSIKVTNEMDWPPFDFNVNGRPLGLSIDVLDLIASRAGLHLEYIHGLSWGELLEKIRKKEIDVAHSMNTSAAREEFLLFTDSYISNQTVIVTKKDNADIRDVGDLKDRTVAVIDGYHQKQVLQERVPGVRLLHVASPLEALKAVSSGAADATVRFNGVAGYLINHHMLINLKFANEFQMEGSNLHELFLGVRDDWPILRSILQKGLESITTEEMSEIKREWISFQDDRFSKFAVKFTEPERKWIREHPEITLGADYKWPPFEFSDETGKHSGLASDYVELLEKATGIKINVRVGVWSDIIRQMKNGALDGFACAVKTDEREEYLDFSTPYLSVPTVIVTDQNNTTINTLEDLRGKTVSINKGSYMHDWLARLHPEIELHLSTSNEASLEAVSYGEADAYIGNLAVSTYIIRERLLTNLKIVKRLDAMVTKISIAIDKQQPLLMSIVQKVIDSLSDRERQEILDRWYTETTRDKITLTEKERGWLKKHEVVRLSGDPAWAPVSYVNQKGTYVGIIPDYFKRIAAKSGLKFEWVQPQTWSEVLKALGEKQIEVIDAITENPERKKLMDFTDVYLKADVVLITRNDIKYIRGLDYIGARSVGTVKDYITESYIRGDFPQMELALYDTASGGLKGLANGEIDVFVIDIPTFEYYTKESALANLKISGLTPYTFSLAIGVAKGNEELLSILNKSLGLLSQREKNEIYNDWVTLEEPLVDYSLLWKGGLSVSFVLLIIVYWNRKLAHEVALRKAAESEALQASKAKSEFLANMSHEIRTPMNSVLGFAELLDHMISDPEQKSYLKSIRTGGKSLLGIINDILDLSKIEAGKITLKSEPVAVEKVFDEIRELFTTRAVQKQLEISFELDSEFPKHILLDGGRLRQILMNLVGNSLKFTDSGGVFLKGLVEGIDKEERKVDFILSVSDTGIGIPENQLHTIFNKFEQRHNQDNQRYGGTGLGLSISKSLSEIMGGRIWVESAPGEGSTFFLEFHDIPVVDALGVSLPEDHLQPSGFQEANVLVVDDVEDNRLLVKAHFHGSRISFFEAENGQLALDVLNKDPIDLVFLDLRMPVLNGYETIAIIRQSEKWQNLPVIAITASVMGEDLSKVEQYGFDGYLRKPVERQDLFRLTKKCIPYNQMASNDVEGELYDFTVQPVAQLSEFVDVTYTELLAEWESIKDRGDYELIARFADRLKSLSEEYEVLHLVEYAKELLQYVESFDIAEVEQRMKQFPTLVELLRTGLTQEGKSDAAQV